jgi:hypothetical protein
MNENPLSSGPVKLSSSEAIEHFLNTDFTKTITRHQRQIDKKSSSLGIPGSAHGFSRAPNPSQRNLSRRTRGSKFLAAYTNFADIEQRRGSIDSKPPTLPTPQTQPLISQKRFQESDLQKKSQITATDTFYRNEAFGDLHFSLFLQKSNSPTSTPKNKIPTLQFASSITPTSPNSKTSIYSNYSKTRQKPKKTNIFNFYPNKPSVC